MFNMGQTLSRRHKAAYIKYEVILRAPVGSVLNRVALVIFKAKLVGLDLGIVIYDLKLRNGLVISCRK